MDTKSLFSVENKTILITGGGRGIGEMMAEGLVRGGATVYITSRDEKTCQQTASKLTAFGPGKCIALPPFDLSKLAGCEALAVELAKRVDRLNALVNNSGLAWAESLDKFSERGWDRVMDLNVKGVFFLTKSLLPLLRKAATKEDPSRIINIGSIAGVRPQPGIGTYSYDASKAALHHLSRKLALDLGNENITVNTIAPGIFLTKMGKSIPLTEEQHSESTVMGRVGQPGDMAGAVIYFCSKASAWVTGTVLPVDGGYLVTSKL